VVASIAIVSFAVLRAASWLMVMDVLFALLLASWAVVGDERWLGLLRGPFSVLRRLPWVPRFVATPLVTRWKGSARDLEPLLRGLALGTLVLLVFGTLLISADGAFAYVAGEVFDLGWVDVNILPARILAGLGTLAVAGGLALAPVALGIQDPFSRPGPESAPVTSRWTMRGLEWQIPLLILNLLFVAFVAIQLAVLFGGQAHVLDTAGLTYAEYARSGFFQLVAIAVLTIGVIALFSVRVEVDTPAQKWILKIGSSLLCVLSLIIVASAFRRLGLYEEEFGFTRLRILIHGVLLWFAALFVLVLVAGGMLAKWLPRAVLALTVVAALAFNIVSPDAFIAEQNVARYERSGKIDVAYLQTLSADAAPSLARLPQSLAACVLAPMQASLANNETWYEWNLARAKARVTLEGLPVVAPGSSCPTRYP
jgi:hypothetical protein